VRVVTSSRNLPNFLIIGAMKGGTTSLWYYLRSHPQVFMPQRKEPHFFSDAGVWSRGLEWYERQFSEAPPTAVAVGEASTTYSKHPEYPGVPARIASVIPDVRLIYVIRQPMERMRSQYLHHVAKGREHDPIESALMSKPTYVNNSRYAMQIACYLEHFHRNQLLIFTSEELRGDRIPTLRRVYEFLEIDEDWVPPMIEQEFYRTVERRKVRPSTLRARRLPGIRSFGRLIPPEKKARAMKSGRLLTKTLDADQAAITESLRRHLEEMLREDVRQLRQFLGPNFDGWGIA
jgi:sulfotransferase family protein